MPRIVHGRRVPSVVPQHVLAARLQHDLSRVRQGERDHRAPVHAAARGVGLSRQPGERGVVRVRQLLGPNGSYHAGRHPLHLLTGEVDMQNYQVDRPWMPNRAGKWSKALTLVSVSVLAMSMPRAARTQSADRSGGSEPTGADV